MANANNMKNIVSYLGPHTVFDGDIHVTGDLHIDGTFSGSIVCDGDVIIGEGSQITGQVTAENILISGTFNGNATATASLEVFEMGHVEGDINGRRLLIHEGGVYKGKVTMDVIQSTSPYEGTFQVIKKS
jgi:cytoskeletal protein CcmA (bactofilin family)